MGEDDLHHPGIGQEQLGSRQKHGQGHGIIVPSQIPFSVLAFGVVVKKRWVADNQVKPLTPAPSLQRGVMHSNSV